MLRALHVFAGAGGSVIAGRILGFESVGCVEIDDYCCEVLKRHGETIVGRDICRFDATRFAGRVDIVIGGSPCQDLSVAGHREGIEGERSGLWKEQLRVAKECRASAIWWENVGGALSSNNGRDFGVVLNDLASAGYDAEWLVNEALEVGAPHHRERVWVLAHARRAGDERLGESGNIRGAASIAKSAASERERGRNAVGNGGETVGDATGSRRGPPHADGESGLSDQTDSGGVADTKKNGRRQGRPEPSERARVGGRVAGDGSTVGNTTRWREQRSMQIGSGPQQPQPVDAGDVADSGRQRLQKWRTEWRRAHAATTPFDAGPLESRLGGGAAKLADGLDFPAARGDQVAGRNPDGPSPQHAWEPPRTIAPLEPVAARLSGRIPRLKALGNGWVPFQAVAAFLEMTEDLLRDE